MVVRGSGRAAARGAVALGVITVVLSLAGVALAAVPETTVSTDPYTNNTSFHATEVEPDTFAFGKTIVGTFQVGRFSDGGASNVGWATSTDGGVTWTHGFLPSTTVFATPAGPWARVSDPAVSYDPKHKVWMISTLGIDSSVMGRAVLISRSTDGGLTWQAPVTASLGVGSAFYDKEWVACDVRAVSPNYGNCYTEWDNANAGNRLLMSRSTDGGLTWTASSVPSASVIGGQPLALPNGTVVVPIDNGSETAIESFVSHDGGATYTGPNAISTLTSHTPRGGLRSDALPSAEVDAAGKVYVVWQDCRFRTGCTANDIVMSTSTDGVTWSPVVRIPFSTTTSTNDSFIPGIGVDRSTSGSTARLGVTAYFYPNTSCTTATCQLMAGFVSSADGGSTWSARQTLLGPLTLTWLPRTTLGYMVGDYISTSWSAGKAHPIVANATSGTCVVTTVGSCHEFMVTPTNGLRAGGAIPVGRERPVPGARSDHPARRGATAF
jgi:BNR repeat-like domain